MVLALLLGPAALAAPLLPYTSRSRPYNGATTTVHGDLRTIGMAGAIAGLADSFFASYDNPAGLAMTLHGGGLLFNGNNFTDGHVQDARQAMNTYDIGAFSAEYPWGWGVGFSNTFSEGMRYSLPATGDTALLETFTREIRLSGARLLFDHHMSVGVSLILAQGAREIEFDKDPATGTQLPGPGSYSYSIGAQLGLLFQLPKRWLIGVSATTPVSFADDLNSTHPALPGFNQHMIVPWKLNVGVGWIPNRAVRFGFGLYFMGLSPGAALLSDETLSVGQALTLHPRMGLFYRMIEFKELVLELVGGTYLEFPRLAGHGPRLHATGGFDVKPWVFNVGMAVDVANQYTNYLLSIGVDVGKILQKLDLIPTEYHPPYAGFFPNPFRIYDDGLARPINPSWKKMGPDMNVIDIGKNLPSRVKEKLNELGEGIRSVGKDALQSISGETEAQVKDKKRKARETERAKKKKKAAPRKKDGPANKPKTN